MSQDIGKVGWRIVIENADGAERQVLALGKTLQEAGEKGGIALDELSNKSEDAVTNLDNLGDSAKNTTQVMKSTKTSLMGVAFGAVSLANNLATLSFGFKNIADVQKRVRDDTLDVADAQEELNEVLEDNRATLKDVERAQNGVTRAQNRLKDSQDLVNDSYVTFGLQMTSSVLSAISTAIFLHDQLAKKQLFSAGTAGINSGAQVVQAGAITATGVAARFAGIAVQFLNRAFLPLLIITTALTLVFGAYQANFGGFKTAVDDALPPTMNFMSALNDIPPALAEGNNALEEGQVSMRNYGTEVEGVGIKVSELTGKVRDAFSVFKEEDLFSHLSNQVKELDADIQLFYDHISIGQEVIGLQATKYIAELEQERGLIRDIQSDFMLFEERGKSLQEAKAVIFDSIEESLQLQLAINKELALEEGANLALIEEQNQALTRQAQIKKRLLDLAYSQAKAEQRKEERDRLASKEEEKKNDDPRLSAIEFVADQKRRMKGLIDQFKEDLEKATTHAQKLNATLGMQNSISLLRELDRLHAQQLVREKGLQSFAMGGMLSVFKNFVGISGAMKWASGTGLTGALAGGIDAYKQLLSQAFDGFFRKNSQALQDPNRLHRTNHVGNTTSGIGGGVGILGGDISASGLTGLQSEKGILGILGLAGTHSATGTIGRMSNAFSKEQLGNDNAGSFIASRFGGNFMRSKGRSSKHSSGSASQEKAFQAYQLKILNGLSPSYVAKMSGMGLDQILGHARPYYAQPTNFGSYQGYKDFVQRRHKYQFNTRRNQIFKLHSAVARTNTIYLEAIGLLRNYEKAKGVDIFASEEATASQLREAFLRQNKFTDFLAFTRDFLEGDDFVQLTEKTKEAHFFTTAFQNGLLGGLSQGELAGLLEMGTTGITHLNNLLTYLGQQEYKSTGT